MKTMLATKREARRVLKPAYWSALFVCAVSFLIYGSSVSNSIPGFGIEIPFTLSNFLFAITIFDSLILRIMQQLIIVIPLYIFITAPLTVGRARYFMRGIDGDWNIRYLFSPFFTRDYFQIVRTMAMRSLMISIAPAIALVLYILINHIFAIIFLCIPIIIYGIAVYYRHRVTPYLLADNPKMKFYESQYHNHKIEGNPRLAGFFAVDLSFLTWYIFGVAVFAIGQFFFMPYHETAIALRYREFFPHEQEEGESPQESDLVHENDLSQMGNLSVSEKPSLSLQSSVVKVIMCLVISASVLLSLLPVGIASAHDEIETIVTTEEELLYAINNNKSPIRIDTSIYLTEGAINIASEFDIVLRGNGTIYVVKDRQAVHSTQLWRLRHFTIHSDGQLTLQDNLRLTIASHVEYGGGVNINRGQFIMEGGRIEYNIAHRGGGVDVADGHFLMYGGVIRGNHAREAGGGVYMGNSRGVLRFTMRGGEISENTSRNGGGVSLSLNAHFAMHSGLITGNTANGSGGGIGLLRTSSASITGGEISYNLAGVHGGGIGSVGYENISIGSQVQFHGNRIDGQLSHSGNNSRSSSIRYREGVERYPQIRWYGESSRPGTHLINNYDISYAGRWLPTQWQFNFMLATIIIIGKGIALLIFRTQEKKAKSRQEVEYAE